MLPITPFHARRPTLEHISALRSQAPSSSQPPASASSSTSDTLEIRHAGESSHGLATPSDTRGLADQVEQRRSAFEKWEQRRQTPRRLQWLVHAGHIALTDPARLGPLTSVIRRTADNVDAMTALGGISGVLAPHADWLRETAEAIGRLRDDGRCPPHSMRPLHDLSHNLHKLIAGLASPELRQRRQTDQHDLSHTNQTLNTVRETLTSRALPQPADPWTQLAAHHGARHSAWLHALRRLGEAAVSPRPLGERNTAIVKAMEDLARARQASGLAPARDENLLTFLRAASFFMGPRHDEERPDQALLTKQHKMVALALGTPQPEPVEIVAALPSAVQRMSALMAALPGLMGGLNPDGRNALAEMLRTRVMSQRLSPADADGHLLIPRIQGLRDALAGERLEAGNLAWLKTRSARAQVHQRFTDAAARRATHGLAWQMQNIASNLHRITGQRHHFVDFLKELFQAEGRHRLPPEGRHEILKSLIVQIAANDFHSAKATDSVLGLLNAGLDDSLSASMRADLLARLVAVMPHIATPRPLSLAENRQVKAAELVANKLQSLPPENALPVFEMLLARLGDIKDDKVAGPLVGAMRTYLQRQLMVAEPDSQRMEAMLPLLRRLIASPVLPDNEDLGRKLQAAAVQALCVGFPRGLDAARRQEMLLGAVGSDEGVRGQLETVLAAICMGRSSKNKPLADVDDATRLGAARMLWILTGGRPRPESLAAFDRAIEDTVVRRGGAVDGRTGVIAMALRQEAQMDGTPLSQRLAEHFFNAATMGLRSLDVPEAKELMPSLIQGFHRLEPAPRREFLSMLGRLAPQGVLESAITNLSHFQGSDPTLLVDKISEIFHGGTLDPRAGQSEALVHLADEIDSASPSGLNALLAFVGKLSGEHRASALSVLLRDALADRGTLQSIGADGQNRLERALSDGLASTTMNREQVSALAHEAARYADEIPASALLAFAPHVGRLDPAALRSLMTAWVNGIGDKSADQVGREFGAWVSAAEDHGGKDEIHTILALARRAYPDALHPWRDYHDLRSKPQVLAQVLPHLIPSLAAHAGKRIDGLSPSQVAELLHQLPQAKDRQTTIDRCYRWSPAQTVEALCKHYGVAQLGPVDAKGKRPVLTPRLLNQGANIEGRGFVELPRLLDDLHALDATNAMAGMARNVGARTGPASLIGEFAAEFRRFGMRSDVEADHMLTIAHALFAKFQPDAEETAPDSYTQQVRLLASSLPKSVLQPLTDSHAWLTGRPETTAPESSTRPTDVIRL